MDKSRWFDVVDFIFAFWLYFWFGGIGLFAILDWLGTPLLPNLLVTSGAIVAALLVQRHIQNIRYPDER